MEESFGVIQMSLIRDIALVVTRRPLHLFNNLVTRISPQKKLRSEENRSYERFHHMDENLPADIEDVLELSAILEVREYDLFGLAYHWWFGHPANNKVLERHFVRYMFNKIVPHWMRHYSRMLLDLREQGILDKEELGISALPNATPQSVRAGLRYTVIVFSLLGLLILIAELAAQFTNLPCMFPPCY